MRSIHSIPTILLATRCGEFPQRRVGDPLTVVTGRCSTGGDRVYLRLLIQHYCSGDYSNVDPPAPTDAIHLPSLPTIPPVLRTYMRLHGMALPVIPLGAMIPHIPVYTITPVCPATTPTDDY